VLNAIVFICGAALMGLEIVAARVLAPWLGNSIFVWGSVISIVMVALSLGYWLGGQVADRYGSTRTLAPVIAGAGLFTVVVPPISAAILPWAADLGPRLGSLSASALIFFLPSLLMAMVSPLGVRLASAAGIEHVGRSAGGLYAVSTAGSIVGTLATAFWLIPVLSIDPLLVGIGLLLSVTAAAATWLPRKYKDPALAEDVRSGPERSSQLHRVLGAVTLSAIAAGALLGTWVLVEVAPPPEALSGGEKVLLRVDTQYHRIIVTETRDERQLNFDKSLQSAMRLDDPYASVHPYTDYLHLALALKPDADHVLALGMGGGTVTKRMWRDYPDMRIDTVEIDPVVVDIAKEYFELPQDERLRHIVQDGRRFVQTTDETYDVIIVDTYYADAIPFHLTTQEFFEEAKQRLEPGGVIACNVIGSVKGSRSELFRSTYRTIGAVWDHVWVFPVGIGADGEMESYRNIIVLATEAGVAEDELRARISNRVGGRVVIPGFDRYAADLYTEPIETADVPLLTDSHAPVDSLVPLF